MDKIENISLADLPVGGVGIIESYSDNVLSLKLLEMGCLPGTQIKLDCIAPLGCPYCYILGNNYHLSLRKSEAKTVNIKVLP